MMQAASFPHNTAAELAIDCGAVLKLTFPRQFGQLLRALFGGGLAYSCGAYVQAQRRTRFHNVMWHELVLLGAGLHWAAVADQLVNWRGF